MSNALETEEIDFVAATAPRGSAGSYRVVLDPSIATPLGPFGGYVAGVAIRAAGAESKFERPTSFSCHFLKPAKSEEVAVEVASLRATKRVESLRVTLSQDNNLILEGILWTCAPMEGVEHAIQMPAVPKPEELIPWQEIWDEDVVAGPMQRIFEGRPIMHWTPSKPPPWKFSDFDSAPKSPPKVQSWVKLRSSSLGDMFYQAARAVMPLDWMTAGAAYAPHRPIEMWLPHMDMSVFFHDLKGPSLWTYVECDSPMAANGLAWSRGMVWSEEGKLIASGMQQMIQRRFDPPEAPKDGP